MRLGVGVGVWECLWGRVSAVGRGEGGSPPPSSDSLGGGGGVDGWMVRDFGGQLPGTWAKSSRLSLCEGLLAPVWEGRQGVEAAFGGTTVPFSHRQK